MKRRLALGVVLLGLGVGVCAGEVEVVSTTFEFRGDGAWRVSTTLRHGDTGWDHYADIWRVVGEDGSAYGERVLLHPHVEEQPFTRGLDAVAIPADVSVVYVEAHDKEHGWSSQRVRVNLNKSRGERFQVVR